MRPGLLTGLSRSLCALLLVSAAPLHARELVRGPEKPLREVVPAESSPCAGVSVCSPGRPGLPTATLRALSEGLHAGGVALGALGLDSVAATQSAAASTRSAPTVSLAPHHSGYRDVTQGAANVSYTTPAYVGMDQPRSVTLMYSSGQMDPKAFFQVDASVAATEQPSHYKLRIRRGESWGTWIPFDATGTDILVVQAAATGATRLAGQFTYHEPTRAYGFYVLVTAVWPDGEEIDSAPVFLRIPIINERSSSIGRGWSMPGLQRLHDQGDGIFATQGDGTGVWFALRECTDHCYYNSPDGDFSQLRWDSGSGTWLRTYPDGSFARFGRVGGEGLMLEQSDRFGNVTAYKYDSAGRLEAITDPVGKVTTLGYTAEGLLGWIQDPMGRRVSTTTSSVYLWRLFDPDGSLALDLHFVGAGVLQTSWNKGADRNVAGTGWDYGYDAFGQLASVTAPQVSTTDAGVMRPVTYVKSLEAAVLPAPGTGTSTTPAARVLPQNVRVETTDPRGNTTKVAVNRLGNPIRVEAPLGRVATASYNAHGQVTRQVSHAGQVTRYTYAGSRLMQVTDSATNQTVNYEYDQFDLVKRVWGSVPEENYAYFFTGTKTDSVRVTVAGRTSQVKFDSRGRQELAIDPEGHATRYVYGDGSPAVPGLGNLETVKTGSLAAIQNDDYRQRITSLVRDAYGRQIGGTDPLGRSSSVAYDSLNRTTRSISAANDTVRYEYAAAGHLWKVIDPKGQVYEYVRNPLGWTVEEKVPGPSGQQTVTHRYDRAGNHTETTNRRGQTVRRAYDALGRVQSLTDLSTSAVTAYAYGPQDRWFAVSNAESTDTVHYDIVGRATQQITRRGTTRYALSSSYNAEGLREGLTMTAPWTRSIGYRYNAAMQLDTLIDLAGGRTAMQYDGDGMLYHTALPLPVPLIIRQDIPTTHVSARTRYYHNYTYSNPIEAEFGVGYTQDKLGRIGTRWSSDMLTRRTYSYDGAGRLWGYDEEELLPSIGCTYTADWDPDSGVKMGPASGADCDAGFFAGTGVQGTHTYDRVGNHTNDGAVTQPGTNRLAQFRGYTMGYDSDGNLISKSGNGEGMTYGWNALGQLTSVTRHGQTTTFGYDGFGRRVRKSGPGYFGSGEKRYLYDGDDLFMELDGAGNVTREYTYYPGVDSPHSVRQGGQMYYYLMEAPGHVAGLVDSQGQIVSRYKYNPWGELESSTDALDQPLRYTAREYDGETGLYFYRARYYDPSLRRFISEDPIGLEGGINPYAYVENDPIHQSDPYGLTPCDEQGWCGGTVTLDAISNDDSCPSGWTRGAGGTCRSGRGATRGILGGGSMGGGAIGGGGGGVGVYAAAAWDQPDPCKKKNLPSARRPGTNISPTVAPRSNTMRVLRKAARNPVVRAIVLLIDLVMTVADGPTPPVRVPAYEDTRGPAVTPPEKIDTPTARRRGC